MVLKTKLQKKALINFFQGDTASFTSFANISGVSELEGITLQSLGAVDGHAGLPGKIQAMRAIFQGIQADTAILGRSVADVLKTYTEGNAVTGVDDTLRVDLVTQFVKQQREAKIIKAIPNLIDIFLLRSFKDEAFLGCF